MSWQKIASQFDSAARNAPRIGWRMRCHLPRENQNCSLDSSAVRLWKGSLWRGGIEFNPVSVEAKDQVIAAALV
jgi:hypothetical protein